MTWLITGGTGQLGIAISQELKKRGETFVSWSSQDLNIGSGPKVLDAIASLKPTIVVNCAAWTDVDGAESHRDKAFLVNATGAENVAVAAKACGAKLIHISTDYVFSGEFETPWKVDDIRNPKSTYGKSKLAGEEKVLANYSERTLLVRTAWLYSPWKDNFLKKVLNLLSQDSQKLRIVNDQIGQPTSASELATRIVDLEHAKTENGIFHATNSGQASWFDFAKEIMELRGDDMTRLTPVRSADFIQKAERPRFSVLNHENWAEHGFEPMQDWKIALRNTIQSMVLRKPKDSQHA